MDSSPDNPSDHSFISQYIGQFIGWSIAQFICWLSDNPSLDQSHVESVCPLDNSLVNLLLCPSESLSIHQINCHAIHPTSHYLIQQFHQTIHHTVHHSVNQTNYQSNRQFFSVSPSNNPSLILPDTWLVHQTVHQPIRQFITWFNSQSNRHIIVINSH